MDVGRTRKFAVRMSIRSWMLAVAVGALLLVFVITTARPSRLAQEALERAGTAEPAAARARADADPARAEGPVQRLPGKDEAVMRARRRDPKEAERVRQLYQELDRLMHVQDRIQGDLQPLGHPAAQTATP